MSDEIDQLKRAAGAYKKDALEARKKFIELRHRQDIEIRNLLIRTADQIAEEIRRLSQAAIPSPLRLSQQQWIEKELRLEAERLTGKLTGYAQRYVTQAVEAGAGFSKAVMINLLDTAGIGNINVNDMYYRVNLQAVEACWTRTQKGLTLSDRIWQKSENYTGNITEIIRQSVVLGQDAVTTARMLEKYVRKDTKTLVRDYPNMMKNMKGKVPEDLCYETLRLVRTETTAAFGEGTVAAAKATPSCQGIKWVLSLSHPGSDICDELAAHNEGLGIGVYSLGNEPLYPAHPNEMCFLVPVHEQPEDFVQRLKRWRNDPGSEPNIEGWYQNTYKAPSVDETPGIKIKNRSPAHDDSHDQRRIKSDLSLLPSRHLDLLKQEGISIITGSNEVSGYYHNGKAIKLMKNVEPGEVIHEVGHFLDRHYDLYNDAKFLKIIENGIPLKRVTKENFVPNVSHDEYFLELNHEGITKFVSELQAKIYYPLDPEDCFIQSGSDIIFNVKLLREYFSEGYREFFYNPENLKKKDSVLYRFIEGLVKQAD